MLDDGVMPAQDSPLLRFVRPSTRFVRPSTPWVFSVSAASVVAVIVLMSTVVFAVNPVAAHLAGASVERIVLERGGCYGRCPVYRLTIRSDGSALYTGEGFVRLRGTYQTSFYPRKFLQFADVLYHRGLFASRRPNLMLRDAPETTISIMFSNGTIATSVDNGFRDGDDIAEDINAGSIYIDGFAGHLCDWHRIEAPRRNDLPAGWYSPISTGPCR